MLFRIFNGYTFVLLFPGPVRLDLGDAILRVAYAPTVSSFLCIISDVTKEYSTWMVRKRKYRRYLDIKILGPRLALGWVTIQGLDVDAVAKVTVKIAEAKKRGRHYMLQGPKKLLYLSNHKLSVENRHKMHVNFILFLNIFGIFCMHKLTL